MGACSGKSPAAALPTDLEDVKEAVRRCFSFFLEFIELLILQKEVHFFLCLKSQWYSIERSYDADLSGGAQTETDAACN